MEELSVPDPLVEPGPAHTEAGETGSQLDEEADNVEDLSRSSSPPYAASTVSLPLPLVATPVPCLSCQRSSGGTG